MYDHSFRLDEILNRGEPGDDEPAECPVCNSAGIIVEKYLDGNLEYSYKCDFCGGLGLVTQEKRRKYLEEANDA